MRLTFRVKMLAMGLAIVVGLLVLAFSTMRSNTLMQRAIGETSASTVKYEIVEKVRTDSLQLMLAAQGLLAAKDDQQLQDKEIKELAALTKALNGSFKQLIRGIAEGNAGLSDSVRLLSQVISEELPEHLETSDQLIRLWGERFTTMSSAMVEMSDNVEMSMEVLRGAFAARMATAATDRDMMRISRAEIKMQNLMIAEQRFVLAAGNALNHALINRHSDKLAEEQAYKLDENKMLMEDYLRQLVMSADSKEEKRLVKNVEKELQALIQRVTVELPDVISAGAGNWGALTSAQSAFEKRLALATRQVQSQLDVIQDAIRSQLNESSTELDDTLVSSARTTYGVFAVVCILVVAGFLSVSRHLLETISGLVGYADAVAAGDLDTELHVSGDNELTHLAESLRIMVAKLKEIITVSTLKTREAEEGFEQARMATEDARAACLRAESAKGEGLAEAASRLEKVVDLLGGSARELGQQVRHVSDGAVSQSKRVSETASAMEEMAASVREVANNAGSASEYADAARSMAGKGAQVVGNVSEAIVEMNRRSKGMQDSLQSLGRQAENIGQVLSIICDIADQTNLLALNAAIEAARAGDAGRGFAVVADEVRKLAEKTISATGEVAQTVNSIQSSTKKAVSEMAGASSVVDRTFVLAQEAGAALQEIVDKTEATSGLVMDIATAAEQQSESSEQINTSVMEIDQIASGAVDDMQLADGAVSTLEDLARQIYSLIEELRT